MVVFDNHMGGVCVRACVLVAESLCLGCNNNCEYVFGMEYDDDVMVVTCIAERGSRRRRIGISSQKSGSSSELQKKV